MPLAPALAQGRTASSPDAGATHSRDKVLDPRAGSAALDGFRVDGPNPLMLAKASSHKEVSFI